jgi:hypoxanthine phosphoribosyltransferase
VIFNPNFDHTLLDKDLTLNYINFNIGNFGGYTMEEKIENILISQDQIAKRTVEVGKLISENYKDKKLYILSLLRGSFIFTADLVRQISIPVKIGFMATSSYENEESSTGNVKIVQDITDDIEGYDVLIVDDIVDTGITMQSVMEHLCKYNPASIKCCVLLDKPERRKVDLLPDYKCFTIPDVFVVGYGLNYGDYYRNVPYVFNWENK